jgi:hypothetical protein
MVESEDRRELFRYSYTRGTAIFIYASGWLAMSTAGYLLISRNLVPESNLGVNLLFAAIGVRTIITTNSRRSDIPHSETVALLDPTTSRCCAGLAGLTVRCHPW